ncbi:unnamed protein product [Effrenium voratum]|uniref:Glutathione peroxidase n=1 Tax=Effrenium voratum TaxID=2562239 RepID=A0AA36HMN1_9DINO|nr:unnamed protein product [Effrenium voratum]
MLGRLQKKYADKPVRFLLFPCNQFGSQEPGTNAEVRRFAEQYVNLGKGSNVIMFAKSNLNGVTCEYSGGDSCTASSNECCSRNDAVYKYLLAKTPPSTIQWNFDKIILDTDGLPFSGETIMQLGASLPCMHCQTLFHLFGFFPSWVSVMFPFDQPKGNFSGFKSGRACRPLRSQFICCSYDGR